MKRPFLTLIDTNSQHRIIAPVWPECNINVKFCRCDFLQNPAVSRGFPWQNASCRQVFPQALSLHRARNTPSVPVPEKYTLATYCSAVMYFSWPARKVPKEAGIGKALSWLLPQSKPSFPMYPSRPALTIALEHLNLNPVLAKNVPIFC